MEKEKSNVQYMAFTLNPPVTTRCIEETYSCLNRLAVSRSSPCISGVSVEPFIASHTKTTYESQVTTLLECKAFSLGLAEAQLFHTSAVIPGDCQNSCPDCPGTAKLKMTHEPKLAKGVSTICVRGGEFYCVSASRILLLPPTLGLLLTSLINSSLKKCILPCNTIPPPPEEQSDAKNLLFWA